MDDVDQTEKPRNDCINLFMGKMENITTSLGLIHETLDTVHQTV